MMLPQKHNNRTIMDTETTKNVHQVKRYRFRVHKLYMCTIIYLTLLVTCIVAEDRYMYRPHRPWPGPSNMYRPIPGYQNPNDTSNSTLHIVNETTIGPEPSDAFNVSNTDLPVTTTQGPTTIGDQIDSNNPDLDDKEDCPDCPNHGDDKPDDYDKCPDCDEGIFNEDVNQDYPNDSVKAPVKTDEDELNAMIEELDTLLSNESAVITVDDVSGAFDQMDTLLATEDETLEFPSTVLTALDALGARADLNGSASVATARRNVAVVMADSAPGRPVRGLRIAGGDYGFSDEALEILQDKVDPSTLRSDDTDAVVDLPTSLAESSRRISFIVFRSDRAFIHRDREQYVVNSKVISVKVENFTKMEEGEVIDIYLKPSTYEPARNMTRACAYWHFTENNTGYWSQEGCTFIKSPTGFLDTCRCTHLTHFAEILVPKLVFSEENETALEIISLIGCFLSFFGLIIIGLTAMLFRSWRNDFNNKIWIQLTVALLINVVSFLVIVFSKFDDYNMTCMIVGIILHYAVLASFCWMLVAAIISYRKLVLVFARNPRRRLLKASAFCWLFPVIIVGTLVAVYPQSYSKRFEGHTPTGRFCYPSGLGLWLSVYVPIGVVVISNWIIFVLILRSVFRTKTIQKHGDSSEMLRRASVCCLLVFLFGLPWIFGLFAYNIVAAYLFTLTTSYQGFVLFIFFVIINTKTRSMWLNKLRIKKKTKGQVSSSLITSKNSPASNEAEQQTPFIEPTSTRTNITSLVSNVSDPNAVAYNVSSGSAIIDDLHYNSNESDIDSFITAKSHENFSEDEIFKSTEGITDIIEDQEEGNLETSRESSPFKKMLVDYKSVPRVVGHILKTDHEKSTGVLVDKLQNNDNTFNKVSLSNSSSQNVESDNIPTDPKITV